MNKHEYAKLFVIVLIAIGILIVCVDLSHAANYKKERTFKLKGQKIKVEQDRTYGAELSKKAKKQLKQYKKVNKKQKVTYKGTISKKQLFKLIKKDDIGKSFEVQKKTGQKVVVKKAVFKHYDSVVSSKRHYKQYSYDKHIKKIENSHGIDWDSSRTKSHGRNDITQICDCYDNYKVKIHIHWKKTGSIHYKDVALLKNHKVIRYFKTVRKPVYMSVTVNNKMYYGDSGYGRVCFFVKGIGIGCEVAQAKLDTFKKWKFWYV